MSASTIARWNAISLERPEESTNLKRKFEANAEDSDDDVSIISRSPSPAPDAMDVEKYDELVRRPVGREVITVETPIKSTNKGFAMLAKLGWVQGQPLGISGQGRVDPIPFQFKSDSTGLGKTRQDVEMIETTVSQRRELDSERQQKESEDQRKAREDAVARKAAIAEEISDTLKAFYCTLCEKQFKNVTQYDEHTNSYAHHHKARFRDMQASARLKPQEEIDKRKEKERKREEKELRKLAAASGVKMAKSTLPAPALAVAGESSSGFEPSDPAAVSGSTSDSSGGGFKKAGWATVGSTSPQNASTSAASSAGGFKKAGWATVGSTSTQGTSTLVSESVPSASGFKEASWANVGSTTASQTSTGWKTVDMDTFQADGLHVSAQPSSNAPLPMSTAELPITLTPTPAQQPPQSKSHLSRVSWQQFQKKNSKRS